MPTEPAEFEDLMYKLTSRDNHIYTFVLEFHTHPSEDPHPSDTNGDAGNIFMPSKVIHSVRAVGIVIYGLGKCTLYDQDGEIPDAAAKPSECVKVRNSR